MKFTLNWLLDHLDTDKSLDEIVDKLSMIGLEVENVSLHMIYFISSLILHMLQDMSYHNMILLINEWIPTSF